MFKSFLLTFFLLFSTLKAQSIETAGDILQLALPLGGAAYSYAIDDYEGLKSLGYAYATTIGLTYTLKVTVLKPRPNGANNYSFPSGHTSSAFSGASYIQRRYGWAYGLPAYLLAAFVGYSRIESNNHDIYDVLAGAALGVASSYYFVHSYKSDVRLAVSTQSIGLLYSYRF